MGRILALLRNGDFLSPLLLGLKLNGYFDQQRSTFVYENGRQLWFNVALFV